MNKKRAIIVISLVFLLLMNLIFVYLYLGLNKQNQMCKENRNFKLLSPIIAWEEVNQFMEKQNNLRASYSDMKPLVFEILNGSRGEYGVYFEDMTTGAWVGINEKGNFMPVSLVKLPLLVSVLKKVERGELALEQKVIIQKEFLDSEFGTLYKKGEGYSASIKELLTYLVEESDNTAFHTLLAVSSIEEFEVARQAMGLPILNDPGQITPKEYANMLRSLYFSTYLRRSFSEVALSLMISTNFNSELPAGVPNTIKVAHKVGINIPHRYYHDCGIIYDDYPYILCVMSKNSTQEEANRIISEISKIVYNYKHKV